MHTIPELRRIEGRQQSAYSSSLGAVEKSKGPHHKQSGVCKQLGEAVRNKVHRPAHGRIIESAELINKYAITSKNSQLIW